MSTRFAALPVISRYAPLASRVLSERGLLLLRAAWVGVLALILFLFVTGVAPLLAQMSVPCDGASCAQWQVASADLTTLHHLGFSAGRWELCFILLDALLLLVFCAVAAALCWSSAPSRMAMFCGFMLLCAGAVWSQAIRATSANGLFWDTCCRVFQFLGPALIIVFFYLFPSGRFVPRWTRWVAALGLSIIGFAALFSPHWLISDSAGPPLVTLWLVISFAGAMIAQVYRYRRISDSTQRRQTKWVLMGFALTTVLFGGIGASVALYFGHGSILPPSMHATIFIVLAFNGWRFPFVFIPISIGIAILRYGLFDIDLVINRTLVYGALTAAVVAFYVLVVGYLGALFHTADSALTSLIATGLIAVIFQPARERVQQGVNRLMYGERDNPYEVLSRLSRRLEGTLAPDDVLHTIVQSVVAALKLPYAAITVHEAGEFKVAAALGVAPDAPISLPLSYGKELVGRLLLAPRAPGEEFGGADRRLLNDLAAHAGMAIYAVQTTTDLRRSQERLVTAREEERRRLRGDLHDGLGPTLASLSQRIEVAGSLIPRQPEAAVELLEEMKGQVRSTITDIRQLVYALRPPTLDEYGLVGAVRDHASQYGRLHGLQVAVDAPSELPPLPAAVEVAAYRIVVEALTNVIRHAEARECRVEIRLRAGLMLEVVDDGTGLPEAYHAGVGVTSMRQRATELGGTCIIESLAGSGTRVSAQLPLAAG